VVLNNASIHLGKLISELRPIWGKRGLFLFFLPMLQSTSEYCRSLVADTQRQMTQTCGLCIHDTNRALAGLGSELHIYFAHAA